MKDRAKWIATAKWGVFFHYLAGAASEQKGADMTVARWNRRIHAFQVEALAKQLAECGAKYFCLTVGQNSGYYLAPNSVYDDIVGRRPSRCAERDLVSDLAEALSVHQIRLMVYLPLNGPFNDKPAAKRLGYLVKKPAEGQPRFLRNWEAVIRCWSKTWGRKVSGWWIDGCYRKDLFRAGGPDFKSLAAAMRAGNPDSLVALNSGRCTYPNSISEHEDYTAGEFNGLLPIGFGKVALTFEVGQAQGHLLGFLGSYWGLGPPRFSAEFVKCYTREVNRRGVVLTWDVPPLRDGRIPAAFLHQLKAINA